MAHWHWLWLLMAGVGGGLAGSIAGLASLVSYPALLAVGLAPVTANVTNTVSLVFSGLGSVWGSRPELAPQRARALVLAPSAAAGGLCGAALLLLTPSSLFTRLVPVLIGVASVAVLVPRRRREAEGRAAGSRLLWLWVFLVAIYGGYFGAASGVVLLAILLRVLTVPLAASNAMKNLLLGLSNLVASLVFVSALPVRWADALPLAVGFLVGGRLGPLAVRRLPALALRVGISCAGAGLAVHLAMSAYR